MGWFARDETRTMNSHGRVAQASHLRVEPCARLASRRAARRWERVGSGLVARGASIGQRGWNVEGTGHEMGTRLAQAKMSHMAMALASKAMAKANKGVRGWVRMMGRGLMVAARWAVRSKAG